MRSTATRSLKEKIVRNPWDEFVNSNFVLSNERIPFPERYSRWIRQARSRTFPESYNLFSPVTT